MIASVNPAVLPTDAPAAGASEVASVAPEWISVAVAILLLLGVLVIMTTGDDVSGSTRNDTGFVETREGDEY